jgi:hypothetical protein
MHWLVIALIVSVAGLLVAAAGMARHIWLHRDRLHSAEPADAVAQTTKTDFESEP